MVVARKLALLWPVGTVTLTGTDIVPTKREMETTAGLTAALFNETVHVLEALLVNVVVRHDREVSWTAVIRFKVTAWVNPAVLAVMTAA